MRRNFATFLKLGLILIVFAFVTLVLLKIMRLPIEKDFQDNIISENLEDLKVYFEYRFIKTIAKHKPCIFNSLLD